MGNHIVPMVVDAIVTGLKTYCIDDVPTRDPSRVSEVKAGRFQESPNNANLRLSVQGGDLDNPNLLDSIFDPEVHKNMMAFAIPAREYGGTQIWVRRGVVRLELFLITEQQDEFDSREIAYTILGRVQGNIERIVVSGLYDDFGEHAIKLFSTQSSFFQSGGPPASYLYRGKVLWDCLTERNFD
jgi:hypothetical protein